MGGEKFCQCLSANMAQIFFGAGWNSTYFIPKNAVKTGRKSEIDEVR